MGTRQCTAQGITIGTIAHRASVANYHDTVWQFVPAPEGSTAKFALVTP